MGGFSWNKAPHLSLLAVAAKDDITTAIQRMGCLVFFKNLIDIRLSLIFVHCTQQHLELGKAWINCWFFLNQNNCNIGFSHVLETGNLIAITGINIQKAATKLAKAGILWNCYEKTFAPSDKNNDRKSKEAQLFSLAAAELHFRADSTS